MLGFKRSRKKQIRTLEEFPQMDPGVPMPVVLADESRLHMIYRLQDNTPHDGTTLNLVSPDHEASIAWVSMDNRVFKFGHPNDEVLQGHPLYPSGLQPYACNEVIESDWLSEVIRINSVHWHHMDRMFDGCRHLIFAFHDSTLEVLTSGWEIRTQVSTVNRVANKVAAEIFRIDPDVGPPQIIT